MSFTIIIYGTQSTLVVLYDGQYVDYWNYDATQSELSVPVLNNGANQIKFTIETSMIDECYAYQSSSGKIFFAGKNSIYYGHKNISELN